MLHSIASFCRMNILKDINSKTGKRPLKIFVLPYSIAITLYENRGLKLPFITLALDAFYTLSPTKQNLELRKFSLIHKYKNIFFLIGRERDSKH